MKFKAQKEVESYSASSKYKDRTGQDRTKPAAMRAASLANDALRKDAEIPMSARANQVRPGWVTTQPENLNNSFMD